MNDRKQSTAIVVGASKEELSHLNECLPGWDCVEVQLEEQKAMVTSIPGTTGLIVVYARKEERQTMEICESLRQLQEDLPILLVIGRYDIPQTIALRQLGKTGFIISPFKEQDLRRKIEELFESS